MVLSRRNANILHYMEIFQNFEFNTFRFILLIRHRNLNVTTIRKNKMILFKLLV